MLQPVSFYTTFSYRMKHFLVISILISLLHSTTAYGQPAYVDSLLRIATLNKQDDGNMKALLLLAIDCHRAEPDKGKAYLHKLISMATAANNYDRQCGAYSLLLSIYQEEGNIDSSLYCVNKLKIVAEKDPGNNKVQTNFNQAMGRYYKKNGDYKAALPYTLAAVKLAEAGNIDKSHIAGQWLNAGDVYESLADYNNAMVCNLKALHFFEEGGNQLGESFCYNNIASIYINLELYNKALNYAQKSLDLKKQLGDRRSICTSLESLGNVYIGLNNLPQALVNYEQALKIALAEKMPIEQASCYFSMAKIFSAQQKDSLAVVYYKKTKTLANKLDNELIAANAEMELSILLNNTDSLRQTENSLVATLQTFKNAGSLENESANYQRLSEFYAASKQYDKALQFTNKYHAVKDSIAGLNIQVQLNSLDEKYNSDKKQKEIELLKKDQELQKQTLYRQRIMFIAAAALLALAILGIALLINRNRLRQRMKELELRNQIAADLHDEVGSSLSSIHLLSQMAIRSGNETTHKDIVARMSSNAKETMDKMGDIVWMIKTDESEQGSLKQRMSRFAYELCDPNSIQAVIELEELEHLRLSSGQRKNIYLIFKEALNNAVKYSGTQKIDIKASIQSKQLTLLVKDYGTGFDIVKISKGNGLDNMQKRAKELKGKLDLVSGNGEGTTVRLIIPT
jgi:two-component system sensor histidine kinase UhpB